jgi:hypothetical protein
MKVKTQIPQTTSTGRTTATPQMFMAAESAQSWETWHKHFGHVSYSGLKKLYDNKLVEGFSVDMCTPKPNCVACTEAKQTQDHLTRCRAEKWNQANSCTSTFGVNTT